MVSNVLRRESKLFNVAYKSMQPLSLACFSSLSLGRLTVLAPYGHPNQLTTSPQRLGKEKLGSKKKCPDEKELTVLSYAYQILRRHTQQSVVQSVHSVLLNPTSTFKNQV